MAKVHGKDTVFTFAGVELTTFLTDVGEDFSRDTAETTAMGQDAKTHIAGTKGAQINLSGWWDSTETTGPDEALFAAWSSGDAEAFVYGPEGDATGAKRYGGSAILTAYSPSSSVEDTVAFTATLIVTGDVTRDEYA